MLKVTIAAKLTDKRQKMWQKGNFAIIINHFLLH